MEVTKWLKLFQVALRIGDGASVRAATRASAPETGKEYVVKDPMGVWIATGASAE